MFISGSVLIYCRLTDKSNYVLFHTPQRNIQRFSFSLSISNQQLKREYCIKYLGIMIDSNLSWKKQVECVLKKVTRGIGISVKFVIMSLKTFNKLILYTYLSFFNLWINRLG